MCDVEGTRQRETCAAQCIPQTESDGKPLLGEINTGGRSNELLIFCLFGFWTFFSKCYETPTICPCQAVDEGKRGQLESDTRWKHFSAVQ